jgi:hypothetical protein
MDSNPQRKRRIFKPGPIVRKRKGVPASANELRKLFNDARIAEKVGTGEFTLEVLADAHPTPPLADEPICTQSQLLAYRDSDGKKIAEAHQYLRTDNTIGASGKPDPKEVMHNGVLYILDTP